MNLQKIFHSLLFATLAPIAVFFLWQKTVLLTLILIAIAFFKHRLLPIEREPLCFVIAGVFGALTENIVILSGVWEYSEPHLMNVPLWLIPLWGLAGIVGISFYQGLIE